MITPELLCPFRLMQFAPPISVNQWVIEIVLSTQVYARPDRDLMKLTLNPLHWLW